MSGKNSGRLGRLLAEASLRSANERKGGWNDLVKTVWLATLVQGDRVATEFERYGVEQGVKVVESVVAARARGYVVVIFADGSRTSGHGMNEVRVVR